LREHPGFWLDCAETGHQGVTRGRQEGSKPMALFWPN
jgi:hypothetical protein